MMDAETILRYTEITWKEVDMLIENSMKTGVNHKELLCNESKENSLKNIIKKWLNLITLKS
jgi:hypothetical protein